MIQIVSVPDVGVTMRMRQILPSVFGRSVALLLVAATAGCAANDSFYDQAERLDSSIETIRNRVILTNIVRASRQVPLNFTSIGNVHASNQLTGALGLPAITFGPHQAVINHLYTFGGGSGTGSPNAVSAQGITSFDVSILESKDFYRGLLQPISPRTTAAFVEQGLPREVLFYLFTDSVVVGAPGSPKREVIRNDPSDPTFPIFRRYMDYSVRYGLSFEPLPGHGAARAEEGSTGAARGGAAPGGGSAGEATRIEAARDFGICFDPRFASPSVDMSTISPICGNALGSATRGRSALITTPEGPRNVEIIPRSTFAVFQYLGKNLALGERGLVRLSSEAVLAPGPQHDDVLFQVEHADGGGCFIGVSYDGESFCVPSRGAPNTTRIIGLLAQLVALSTSVSDLPLTQTVRIAQ